MPNRPSAIYERAVLAGRWQADPAQRHALQQFDRIYRELNGRGRRWLRWLQGQRKVRGLYLWGGVGRGKTMLCDLLFDNMPGVQKQRWHFHRFMLDIHARMRALTNTADTLAIVAEQLADEMDLLILDEFFVNDIADAMILGRLLEQLFERSVALVTTSNIAPDGLYANGLQRARFLPAIELLNQHCIVHRLESPTDYRLRQLTCAETYLQPLNAENQQVLADHYVRLSADLASEDPPLIINDRPIPARALCEGIGWFDFAALCEGPRSAADYIEIARHFHTILLDNVPRLDDNSQDPVRRFVHLIDELYDRNVNLIIHADAAPTQLYQGVKLRIEFERTASRLIEMRSREYLAREHRP